MCLSLSSSSLPWKTGCITLEAALHCKSVSPLTSLLHHVLIALVFIDFCCLYWGCNPIKNFNPVNILKVIFSRHLTDILIMMCIHVSRGIVHRDCWQFSCLLDVTQSLYHYIISKAPVTCVRALRNGDVLLFVCLSVRSGGLFICS